MDKDTLRSIRQPPSKAPLSVESMGEPAEVLVIRRPPRAASNLGVIFTEEPLQPLPPSLEGTSDALLHGIDAERGIADIEMSALILTVSEMHSLNLREEERGIYLSKNTISLCRDC